MRLSQLSLASFYFEGQPSAVARVKNQDDLGLNPSS